MKHMFIDVLLVPIDKRIKEYCKGKGGHKKRPTFYRYVRKEGGGGLWGMKHLGQCLTFSSFIVNNFFKIFILNISHLKFCAKQTLQQGFLGNLKFCILGL